MRYARIVGLMVAVALGACAAEPASDDATSGASTPAGFETWLEGACPTGRQVGLYDGANSGEPQSIVTCEELRQKAMADEGARQRLLDVYTAQTASTAVAGPEDAGEVKQPLFLQRLCGMVVMMGGIGASRTYPPGDSSCSEGIAGGGFAMSILCGLLPF